MRPRDPTSDTRKSAGFTLIELMIVITIMGLAAAVVVLVMPDPRGRVHDDATRFAARAKAAQDAAIIGAHPVSVWINASGYGFDERVATGWQAISEKPLRVSQWSRGTRAIPSNPSGRDRVIFDATGMTDRAMSVQLMRDGQSVRVSIGANGSVRVDG